MLTSCWCYKEEELHVPPTSFGSKHELSRNESLAVTPRRRCRSDFWNRCCRKSKLIWSGFQEIRSNILKMVAKKFHLGNLLSWAEFTMNECRYSPLWKRWFLKPDWYAWYAVFEGMIGNHGVEFGDLLSERMMPIPEFKLFPEHDDNDAIWADESIKDVHVEKEFNVRAAVNRMLMRMVRTSWQVMTSDGEDKLAGRQLRCFHSQSIAPRCQLRSPEASHSPDRRPAAPPW